MSSCRNSPREQRKRAERRWKRAAVLGTWTDALVRLIQIILK